MFAIGFVEEIFVVGRQPQSQVWTVDYVAPVAPPGHSLSSLQLPEKAKGGGVAYCLCNLNSLHLHGDEARGQGSVAVLVGSVISQLESNTTFSPSLVLSARHYLSLTKTHQ